MKLRLIILLLIAQTALMAQSKGRLVSFNYDSCGNRLSEVIIILPETKTDDTSGIVTKVMAKLPAPESSSEITAVIYPNPTSSILNIDITSTEQEPETIHIKVFNMIGEEVMSEQLVNGNNAVLNMQKLSKGMYVLRIERIGLSSEWKIIKL